MSKKIVLALGGNALGDDLAGQMQAVRHTARTIVDLIALGHQVVVTHGNGPQVGMINQAFEAAAKTEAHTPMLPMSVCVALSQGYIGYDLQNAIREELLSRQLDIPVATLITQVEVDANDKAFLNPTKPIGSFFSKEEAEKLSQNGYIMKEDAGRGYRRVVASPMPVDIIEKQTVKALMDDCHVVITVGGGGIPVIREGNHLRGASAVIDKDWASAKLAEMIDADLLIILTAVEKVAINFGKPDEQWLDNLSLRDAERFIEEGHFAKGSMLPKVEAAAAFARSGPGRKALITMLSKAKEGIEGKRAPLLANKLYATGCREPPGNISPSQKLRPPPPQPDNPAGTLASPGSSAPRRAVFHLQDLRQHADGNLVWRLGADVIANRRPQTADIRLRHAVFPHLADKGLHFPPAGQQPQPRHRLGYQPVQRLAILVVGGDQYEILRPHRHRLDHFRKAGAMDQPRRKRKSVGTKAGGIDIADADVKIHPRRGVGNRAVDVPGADQQQARAQAVHADVNRHRAAAVGAHGVAAGARHAAVEDSRRPFAQRFQRRIDDFTLHHPAADGAHNRTVLPDKHLSGVSGVEPRLSTICARAKGRFCSSSRAASAKIFIPTSKAISFTVLGIVCDVARLLSLRAHPPLRIPSQRPIMAMQYLYCPAVFYREL